MAEVKNFNDYKKNDSVYRTKKSEYDEGDYEKTDSSYLDKINKHKKYSRIGTIAAIICIVILVFFLYNGWKNKEYTECRIIDEVELTGLDTSDVYALGDNILICSNDGVNCIESDGNLAWSLTYEMQDPIVAICKDKVAIGDYDGNQIYVADSDGSLGTINTNLPIRNISISEKAIVAVTLNDGDVTRIKLFDTNSSEIATIKATIANSGYPMSMAISQNAELLGITYLSEDAGEIVTKVAFFNFGDVGQNVTDNMVSSFNYSQTIIPYICFMNSNTNFAVADDRILFFKGSDVPNNPITKLIQDTEILSIYNSDDYVGLVCTNDSEDGAYKLCVYNESGDEKLEFVFDIAYTNICFEDDQFVIYNDNEWMLVGLDGKIRYDGSFDDPIVAVLPGISRSHFKVVTTKCLMQIELR